MKAMIETLLDAALPNMFNPNISERIVENARLACIEVRPTPCPEGYHREVILSTPKGHYLTLQATGAQLIAVDDYRAVANIYERLIPGYRLVEICEMLAGDVPGKMDPAHAGRFVSISYLPIG